MNSFALINAAQKFKGPVLIVTEDTLASLRLENELKFFAPEYPVHHFLDWETLPYDNFSPHNDIISQRIETLYGVSIMEKGVILVALPTLLQRLPPIHYLQASTFILNLGDSL